MSGYLSSEVMRARNSTLQWLPLIAMPFLALILIMQVSVCLLYTSPSPRD